MAELSIATLHVPDNAPDVVAQTVRAPDTTLGNTVIVPLTHRGLPETLAAAAGAFETIVLPDNEPAPISMEKVSLPGLVLVVSEPHASMVYVVPVANVPLGTEYPITCVAVLELPR